MHRRGGYNGVYGLIPIDCDTLAEGFRVNGLEGLDLGQRSAASRIIDGVHPNGAVLFDLASLIPGGCALGQNQAFFPVRRPLMQQSA